MKTKHNEFVTRKSLNDKEFMRLLNLEGDQYESITRSYRQVLGRKLNIPIDKIYPTDCFNGNLSIFLPSDWDVLMIFFAIEEEVGIPMEYETVKHLSDLKGVTVGEWLQKLLQALKLG